NNIQTLTVNTTSNSSIPRSPTNGKMGSPFVPNNNNNNNNKTAHTDEHNHEDIKKCSMKTVEDVISRIEWDN
ncbi:unnamed protein product, partial [Rotaria magnacalcarata]